jgi:hypothetical protein
MTNNNTGMDRKYTLSLSQLRDIFVAGEDFERETNEFDRDERDEDEVTALDFGDFISQMLDIDPDEFGL